MKPLSKVVNHLFPQYVGEQATDSILCNLGLGTLLLIALSLAKRVKLAIGLLNVKIGAKIRGC